MILYSHRLYSLVAPALGIFERSNPPRQVEGLSSPSQKDVDVIVFGLGRYGGTILKLLRDRGLKVLGVDFSPIAVRRWNEEGVDTLYRDIADAGFIASLSFHGVRWVVCAIPEHDLGLAQADPRVDLVQALRAGGYTQGIAVAATRDKSITRLQKAGADLVDMPFRDAAVQAVDLLMGEWPRAEIEIIEPEEQRELAL